MKHKFNKEVSQKRNYEIFNQNSSNQKANNMPISLKDKEDLADIKSKNKASKGSFISSYTFNGFLKSFKQKKNLLIFLLTLFSLFSLAIILIFRLPRLNEDGKANLDLNSLIPGRILFDIDKNEAKDYYPLSESIFLKTTDGKSFFISPKGENLLNLDFGFSRPLIQEQEGTFVITEQNSNHYTVFNKKGLLYRGKIEGSILQAAISEKGFLALLVDQNKQKAYIKVFDNQGQSLFDIHIQDELNSGFVMDMFFGKNDEILFVSMLNLNASSPFSIINAYSYKTNNLGELLAEYKPQGNTALVHLRQDTNNNLYAFSSKEVMRLNTEYAEPLLAYNSLYYGSFYQNKFFVVAQASEGSAYRFKVKSISDAFDTLSDEDYLLPSNPNHFSHKGRYIAMTFGNKLYRFDLNNPYAPSIFDMREPVYKVYISNNGLMVVVSASGLREIS